MPTRHAIAPGRRSLRRALRPFVRHSLTILALLVGVSMSMLMAGLHLRVDAPVAHRSAASPWSPHGARAWGSRLFDQWPAVRPRRR
jgi:hypothetical protein